MRSSTRRLDFNGAAGGGGNNADSSSPSDFGVVDYGRLEFPASKRAPAKWARVANETDELSMSSMVRMLVDAWRLPAPSVIISVTGGARSLDLNDKQKLVFRRGLLEAAKRASTGGLVDGQEGEMTMVPWVVTGGTHTGVMELVGRAMAGLESDAQPIPCIGVAPWGIVSQREHMAQKVRATTPGARHEPLSKKRSRLGFRYVYGSRQDDDTADVHEKNALDQNHSHFLLVDDGSVGSRAYAGEIGVRTSLETELVQVRLLLIASDSF